MNLNDTPANPRQPQPRPNIFATKAWQQFDYQAALKETALSIDLKPVGKEIIH